jgi:hypothetical protein
VATISLIIRICNAWRIAMTQIQHIMSSTNSLSGRLYRCSVRRYIYFLKQAFLTTELVGEMLCQSPQIISSKFLIVCNSCLLFLQVSCPSCTRGSERNSNRHQSTLRPIPSMTIANSKTTLNIYTVGRSSSYGFRQLWTSPEQQPVFLPFDCNEALTPTHS